jgi:nitrite reductase/ring-hydroxylating ferredoxin subunit
MTNDNFERVARVGDIREADMMSVTLSNGAEVVLAKCNGQIFCVDIMCTHQEAWLDSGYVDTATYELQCPLHEGRFDLRTGAVTNEPPTEPIRAYNVKVEGNDVYVGPPK